MQSGTPRWSIYNRKKISYETQTTLTSASSGCDGCAVVFQIQRAGSVQNGIHEYVCFTFFKHV